jgi:hypothetical protein
LRIDSDRWVLPITWLTAAVYLYLFIRVGWIPHDEGTIAQSAERVLMGQLPHRDFIDLYTGGLSFLHALSFRLFGIHLLAPRFFLYGFALLWVPCVYWIARRFVSPLAAAGVTGTAIVWSVPHYFVAMPSWYNLFFATFAAAGLLEFVERRKKRYLVLAGVAAGLSVLVKISGLFTVAAGLLFIAFLEAEQQATSTASTQRSNDPFRALTGVALLAFLGLLLLTLRSQADIDVLFHFFLPALAVAALIAWTERQLHDGGSFWPRARRLLSDVGVFAAGVAIPLAIFASVFIAGGALGYLLHGAFVLPTQRLTQAVSPPPPMFMVVPLLALLALVMRVLQRLPVIAAAAIGLALLIGIRFSPLAHLIIIIAAQSSVPVIVAGGALLVFRRGQDSAVASVRRQQAAGLLVVLAMATLIQFPYAYRIYFLYVAPLAVLAGTGVFSLWRNPPRVVATGVLLFFMLLGATWMNHRLPIGRGFHYRAVDEQVTMDVPRGGGIRVIGFHADTYGRVVQLLQRHSRTAYTYAGPDAPEVYFLSGLQNPTPHLFEFFAGPAFEAELISTIDSLRLTTLAINLSPDFTAPLSADFMTQLSSRFPEGERVGNFIVVWRD